MAKTTAFESAACAVWSRARGAAASFVLAATAVFARGEALGGAIPLPEHPRPDWNRAEWINLNGQWDFGFEEGRYDRKITVPFGWGSPLSGVEEEPGKDVGWYRRSIEVPAGWKGKRVFIVVGASDHDTAFFIDGKRLGMHSGGYIPFEFEITDEVKWGVRQTVEFKSWDPGLEQCKNGHFLFGKQGYGNVRGIWQTVYLEARGREYMDSVRFSPSIADSKVAVEVRFAEAPKNGGVLKADVAGTVCEVPVKPGAGEVKFKIPIDSPRLWTPDDPHLYDATLEFGGDRVSSYFGFREIGIGKTPAGHAYPTLNGKPVYLQFCLDQSFHPDGYYTFPSDEAMKNEILISKKLALTGNRIHIKAEVPRKLYWADKLGLLIQADVPNSFGPASDKMFAEHWKCFEGMVKRDFNHPSIYQWTLFNETWGLRDKRHGLGGWKYPEWSKKRVAEAYLKAKKLDPTRLVDDNSACERDHTLTDVNTWHRYMPAYEWESKMVRVSTNTYAGSQANYARGWKQNGAPMMNMECGNVWGYSGSTGDCDFTWDYHAMINAFRRHLECSGWCYTEHHDVIIEWNGYVRSDRTWKETGLEELAGMSLADFHAPAALFFAGRRGFETGETVKPGETKTIPVGVSLVTDAFAGRKLELSARAWWFDRRGGKKEIPPATVPGAFAAKSWQCEKLWNYAFAAPGEPAAGCVVFDLLADGEKIARNFWSFSTVDGKAAMAKPSKAQWSEGTAQVLDGAKLNGFGKGYFEFELPAPAAGGVFKAELSAKRKNGKDSAGKGKTMQYVQDDRSADRSKNPNSYPQTSCRKFPANVKIFAGGRQIAATILPDDPADHRGLLSWLAQPHDRKLREAGSYGFLVEAKIPPAAVKNGKVTVRLESDAGLGVYGPRFGRYPLGPAVLPED